MSKILELSSKYIYNSILDNSNRIEKLYSKLNNIYFEQTGYTSKPQYDKKLGINFDNENGSSTIHLISNYNSTLNLLDNDFHIEFWVRINETYGYNVLFSRVNSGYTSYAIMYIDEILGWPSNSLTLALSSNGSTWDQKITLENINNFITFKKETHIAIFRNGDQINITINGILRKQYDLPTDYIIYSNINGVQFAKYDTDEYVESTTKPRGKLLNNTTTSSGETYVVNGDSFPLYSTYGSIYSQYQYESDTEQRTWYGFITKGAIWEYNITTNTGILFDNTTTGIGGIHQVNGDPLPDKSVLSFAYNHITKKLYVGQTYTLWEYDYITNTGYIMAYSNFSTHSWKGISIDTDINRLYGCYYGAGLFISGEGMPKYFDLNISYDVNNIVVSSGDVYTPHTANQVNFNYQKSKIGTTSAGESPDYAWLYDIATENGKKLNYTNTNIGGIYEVIGDPAPNTDAEKCDWYIDLSGNSVFIVGYWDTTTGGIWFYSEINNTGKLYNVINTSPIGDYEVIGDPLPNNIIYNLSVIDNIIYAGTNSGMWVYNPNTNIAKTFTIVSTGIGGDYEVNGDALTSDTNKDTYFTYVSKFGNTIYKPLDTADGLWIYKEFSASYLNGNIDDLIMYNGITGSTPYNSLGYNLNDQIFIPTLRCNSLPSTYKQIIPNNLQKYVTFALSSKNISIEDETGSVLNWNSLVGDKYFEQITSSNRPVLVPNEGVTFGGTNDYLDGGSGSTYDIGTGTFHFECWAKYNTVSTEGTLLNISNGVHPLREFNFAFRTYGMRVVQSNSVGTSTNFIELYMSLSASTWYHIILSRDEDDNQFIIIDGILRKKVLNNTFVLEGTYLWLGWFKRLQSADRNLDGNMDNIQLLSVNKYNVSNKNEGDRIFTQLPQRQSAKSIKYDPFVFSVSVTAGNIFTIPMVNGYEYDYSVDWGDGNKSYVKSYNDSNAVHTYTSTSSFDIKINGTCEYFCVNNISAIDTKIIEIKSWGDLGFKLINFNGCSNLTTLPSGSTEQGRLTEVVSFYRLFYFCTKLESIPSGIFDGNVNVTNFSYSFYYCTKLTTIPSNLFKDNINVTTFEYTFYNCTALTLIPNELFNNNIRITNYNRTFYQCTNLVTLPSELFNTNVVTSFDYTFYSCTKLETINGNIFNSSLGSSFYQTFYNCQLLSSIPSDLFGINTNATQFYKTFERCYALATLPSRLFSDCTNINNFRQTFYYCTSLTTISDDIFSGCTNVTTFNATFQDCTSLITIPTDLFSSNTNVIAFEYTFQNCSSLTELPIGLFSNNINVERFDSTFYNCTDLATIHSDLFSGCTNVTEIIYVFDSCSSLTTIPTDLFRYNTLVSNWGFYRTFYNCTSLETIPTDLFRYNTSASDRSFYQTFYNCIKLQLNRNIFYADGDQTTRFSGLTISFYQCFYRTTFTGTQGEAPDLWNCTIGTPTKTQCFGGAGNSLTSLSNYGDIPIDWI